MFFRTPHVDRRFLRVRRAVVPDVPQAQVLQYLFDDVRLFDKADDFHCSPAFGAAQWVHFIDFLYYDEKDKGIGPFYAGSRLTFRLSLLADKIK
jgi:hypothetical protein